MQHVGNAAHLRLRWCAAAALLVAPATLGGQSSEGPLWDSYARAATVLARALEAHGGTAAIRDLPALSFRWEGEDYAPTQGRVPTIGWEPEVNARAVIQDVRIDAVHNRYRVDREFRFPGGYLNAFRLLGNGRELLSYNHHPERGMGGTVYQRDTTGVAARRNLSAAEANMPVLLLRTALGRAGTLRHLGETGPHGAREEAITHTTADGDLVTLYFDAATHRLTRRELVGAGSLGDEVNTFRFADYRTVAGLVVPHRMEVTWNGILTGRHRLVHFSTGAELPDSLFRIPDGYAAATPPRGPAVVPFADGIVYLENLGGGYRMLAVDTDEGLVVVDAPLSPAVTGTAIRLLEQTFPGRPVRYVVITHHHADHIAGIPAFAALGATILVAPGSEEYVRRMSTVTRTFGRIDGSTPAAAAAPPMPQIETLAGRRVVGSGTRSVEILNVGPTSHASAMLAVYVPSQGLLFQGDLLRINAEGGVVAAPEAARDLEGIIRRYGLDVRVIGAVHGLNGTMADLSAAVRMGSQGM
jgi:glyoxylase-like metal-dependent hydrolase (beta-lactamase superfamily II)